MAVTSSTLTELTDLAKDLYTNLYVPQMGKKMPLKAQFDALEKIEFAGKKIIFGLKLTTGGGASNAGANKSLPPNADGEYDQAEQTVKRTYVRMAIDGLAMEVTKQKSGSYRPAVAEKMEDRMSALTKECNRQLFGDSLGKLAMTDTAGASATQVLSRDYFLTLGGNPARHIFKGDMLAFKQSDGTHIGRKTVSSKTATLGSATVSVVLDSSITSTTSGFVTKSTADDDNYTTGEVSGLLAGMVQTGTFQGVSIGSTYQATKFHNSGTEREISDSLVMTLFGAIHAQSDEYPNLVVTRAGVVQKYTEIFIPIRRIDGQDIQTKGGFKPLTVIQHAGGDCPVLTDNDCPGGSFFALNTAYINSIDLIGEQWAAFDGAQFTRVTDQDGAEGYVRKYWNLAWRRLNVHGWLTDLKDIAQLDRLFS